MTSVSLSVTPEFSEFRRCFNKLLLRGLQPLRPFMVRVRVAFGVMLLWMAVMLVLGIFDLADWWVAIVLAASGLGLAIVAIPTIAYLGARRQWRATPELREPRTYTFDDAGIRIDGETFQNFAPWSNIAIERVADQFVLGIEHQRYYFIPVRAFDSDEALASFCQLVESKVSGCRL